MPGCNDDCTYAKWDVTSIGTKHPSGDGSCTWKPEPMVLPVAFYWLHRVTPAPHGGHISRRRDKYKECPCYEKATKSPPRKRGTS